MFSSGITHSKTYMIFRCTQHLQLCIMMLYETISRVIISERFSPISFFTILNTFICWEQMHGISEKCRRMNLQLCSFTSLCTLSHDVPLMEHVNACQLLWWICFFRSRSIILGTCPIYPCTWQARLLWFCLVFQLTGIIYCCRKGIIWVQDHTGRCHIREGNASVVWSTLPCNVTILCFRNQICERIHSM